MARCQPHDLVTLAEQKWVRTDNQSGSLLGNGREGCVDLAFGAGVQDIDLQPEKSARRPARRASRPRPVHSSD